MTNLTPHEITIILPTGDRRFPPSGHLARVATVEVGANVGDDGYPAVRRTFGAVEIPPEATVGDGLILVSSLVLEAAKSQGHPLLSRMVAPDTGPTAIREAGRVVAVTRLVVA
jgi:hypothetical protein